MAVHLGQHAEYERRHSPIWQELQNVLAEHGAHRYSIFLDEETLHLFAIFKVRTPNEVASLPEHPLMRRWWDYMKDLMETHPDGRPIDWPLIQMFHLE